ncbi:unnamed protein product [Symbiodinium sp. CCMP2456]|nr:unnamed protein product [Symbiodinium sp. CCMP2456]
MALNPSLEDTQPVDLSPVAKSLEKQFDEAVSVSPAERSDVSSVCLEEEALKMPPDVPGQATPGNEEPAPEDGRPSGANEKSEKEALKMPPDVSGQATPGNEGTAQEDGSLSGANGSKSPGQHEDLFHDMTDVSREQQLEAREAMQASGPDDDEDEEEDDDAKPMKKPAAKKPQPKVTSEPKKKGWPKGKAKSKPKAGNAAKPDDIPEAKQKGWPKGKTKSKPKAGNAAKPDDVPEAADAAAMTPVKNEDSKPKASGKRQAPTGPTDSSKPKKSKQGDKASPGEAEEPKKRKWSGGSERQTFAGRRCPEVDPYRIKKWTFIKSAFAKQIATKIPKPSYLEVGDDFWKFCLDKLKQNPAEEDLERMCDECAINFLKTIKIKK